MAASAVPHVPFKPGVFEWSGKPRGSGSGFGCVAGAGGAASVPSRAFLPPPSPCCRSSTGRFEPLLPLLPLLLSHMARALLGPRTSSPSRRWSSAVATGSAGPEVAPCAPVSARPRRYDSSDEACRRGAPLRALAQHTLWTYVPSRSCTRPRAVRPRSARAQCALIASTWLGEPNMDLSTSLLMERKTTWANRPSPAKMSTTPTTSLEALALALAEVGPASFRKAVSTPPRMRCSNSTTASNGESEPPEGALRRASAPSRRDLAMALR